MTTNDTDKPMDDGRTEDEMLSVFGNTATFLGGGCYSITYFGRIIYNKCTQELFQEWLACFVLRDGRYYYS